MCKYIHISIYAHVRMYVCKYIYRVWYNGHSTTADMVAAGVPIVTLPGLLPALFSRESSYIDVYIYTYIYTYIYIDRYICIYMYIDINIYMYVCIYIFLFMYMYVCMYVYISGLVQRAFDDCGLGGCRRADRYSPWFPSGFLFSGV